MPGVEWVDTLLLQCCECSSHMKLEKRSLCAPSASSDEHSVTTIAFHHSKASNTCCGGGGKEGEWGIITRYASSNLCHYYTGL